MTTDELARRFDQLVMMMKGNMQQLVAEINAAKIEIAALRTEVNTLKGTQATAVQAQQAQSEDQVVGTHPVTGAPVTAAQVKADPKLRLRMVFSESDA